MAGEEHRTAQRKDRDDFRHFDLLGDLVSAGHDRNHVVLYPFLDFDDHGQQGEYAVVFLADLAQVCGCAGRDMNTKERIAPFGERSVLQAMLIRSL